jgi:hypothetical protein
MKHKTIRTRIADARQKAGGRHDLRATSELAKMGRVLPYFMCLPEISDAARRKAKFRLPERTMGGVYKVHSLALNKTNLAQGVSAEQDGK